MENKYFTKVPQQLRYDFLERKLTLNEFLVMIWILLTTNPYNGKCSISYRELSEDVFKGQIKYDNIRKIISSLRRHNYISYESHKGSGGKFVVYPTGFELVGGKIQDKTKSISFPKPPNGEAVPELPREPTSHNSDRSNHNFASIKDLVKQRYGSFQEEGQFTTPQNDKRKENNSIIDINKFQPKNPEEARCLEIATELGETDMRFILSCLKKHSLPIIEGVFGDVREIMRENTVQSPGALFNSLINKKPP